VLGRFEAASELDRGRALRAMDVWTVATVCSRGHFLDEFPFCSYIDASSLHPQKSDKMLISHAFPLHHR
jgi:hypothetical protein